jgi:hypothetical protein
MGITNLTEAETKLLHAVVDEMNDIPEVSQFLSRF